MIAPKSGSGHPHASVREQGSELDLELGGEWQLTRSQPLWRPPGRGIRQVRVTMDAVTAWDTSLPLFLYGVRRDCAERGVECDLSRVPEHVRGLVDQFAAAQPQFVAQDRTEGILATLGRATLGSCNSFREILKFLGECTLGLARAVRRPTKFRWKDCLQEMQQCGAMALPIMSLIGLLVGLTLAYQAAVELRQFGADIWVADLIGLSVVREMGPIMEAVLVSGRTGASFAASLGNMKTNEEIDALEVLGVSPVEFLVLPRLVALAIMMPILALYVDAVAILGGVVISAGILNIQPAAYWAETKTAVVTGDVVSGLIKATAFGILIGLAGCLRGLQADRSAAGVGRAATSAVVTSILLIIIADAVFAVLFHVLGI